MFAPALCFLGIEAEDVAPATLPIPDDNLLGMEVVVDPHDIVEKKGRRLAK
jgi:hypothetical protein